MADKKCFTDKLVPLSKVVNAALLSSYQDAGRSKELYYHFAGRAAKKLQTETFHIGKQRALLTVNHATKTVTLPIAFDEEVFVGYIENGQRVSLRRNTNLINEATTEEIECEDSCPKCQQDKGICNDLETTETEEVVIVNGSTSAVTAVSAIGGIVVDEIGSEGDEIEIFVDDPVNGSISLGTYAQQSSDTTPDILAASIADAMSYTGYVISSEDDAVNISAPSSYGATINGGSRLTVVLKKIYVEILEVQSVTTTSAFVIATSVTSGLIGSFDETGIVLSTSPNPDMSDTVYSAGAGSGNFGTTLTGLTSGTTYYLRAYGIYGSNTIFSDEVSLTTL